MADLCEHAARQALARAGVQPDELNLLIVATDTPEYVSPSTSAVLQHRLRATGAGTFDLDAACAGFVTALDVAAKYITSDCEPALLIYEEQFQDKALQLQALNAPALPNVWPLAKLAVICQRGLEAADPIPFTAAELDEDDPVFILYTSGTTGSPRARSTRTECCSGTASTPA